MLERSISSPRTTPQSQEPSCPYVEFGYAYFHRELQDWKIARYSKKRPEYKARHIVTQDRILALRRKRGNTGVYKSVYAFENEDLYSGVVLGDFYLDLDAAPFSDASLALIKSDVTLAFKYLKRKFEIEAEQCRIFFSGSKGFHIIVPHKLFGSIAHERLNEGYRFIFDEIKRSLGTTTTDPKMYDRRRLLRLANSIHEQTGLYKVPLKVREFFDSSAGEIVRFAKKVRFLDPLEIKPVSRAKHTLEEILTFQAKRKRKVFTSGDEHKKAAVRIVRESPTPPCMREILDEYLPQGGRNNRALVLASHLRQRGLSEEEAARVLEGWNEKRCDPPLPLGELEDIVKNVYTHGYRFGCEGIKGVASCRKESCAVYKESLLIKAQRTSDPMMKLALLREANRIKH